MMFAGMYEQDIVAIVLLGIIANFLFSLTFAIYLTKNIGMHEMLNIRGDKKQSWFVSLSLLIPYAKMLITLYRVAILQIYFLNAGRTHKEYWEYLTHEERE